MSGVTVATMMASTSVGSTPRAARQRRRGFDGQSLVADPFVDEVTLADAGALDDPLVVGVDHFFEVCIGEDTGWNVGADGGDLGANGRPGLQGETQNGVLQVDVNSKNLIAVAAGARKADPFASLRDAKMRRGRDL